MPATLGAVLRRGCVMGAFLALFGLGTAVAQTSPTGKVTADLRYEEPNFSVNSWSDFKEQSNPFKAEPKGLSRKVARGEIKFTAPHGLLHVGTLWDQGNGKLYIDANRNGDLTDDASFDAVTPRQSNYHTFSQIHLSLRDGTNLYENTFQATFYRYSTSLSVTLSSKSCWLGRVSLQGTDWQVGVLEGGSGPGFKGGNGYLLIRPWSENTKTFFANDNALNCVSLNSTNLFFGKQAYNVDCRYVEGTPPKYQIEFTPQEAKLGKLQITGKFIDRLVLRQNTRDRYSVVLDKPEGEVQVPVGGYQQPKVSLTGNIDPVDRSYSPDMTSLTVVEGKPAILNAGGPLTNTVSVSRRGDSLAFSFSIMGAGGMSYGPSDRSNPPRWTVYRDDKQIASGKFAFG